MMKRIFPVIALVAGISSTGYAAEPAFAPQIVEGGGIKVTVAPQNLSAQGWEFEVTLETHTQPLNDDLAKFSSLVADGKQHAPLEWKGAPPGGHHRKGVLYFKAISPQPSSLELQIRLSVDAAPRNFRWELKGANHGK